MNAGRITIFRCRAGLAIGAGVWLMACASPPSIDRSLSPHPLTSSITAPSANGQAPASERSAPTVGTYDGAVAGFVDALVQLPGYAPLDTTFAFERRALAGDDFLQALEYELEARGYGLRTTTTLGSANDVGHVAEWADTGEITRTVAFGPVQMRRRFAQQADRSWFPTSSLFIRGADASRVTLGGAAALPVAASREMPPTATTPAPVARTGPTATTFATTSATTSASAVPAAPRNVAELGRSNYAGVFERYANVDEVILVFPNDSMQLGSDNKRLIQQAVSAADRERDLFSLIGCSFGATAIENGNEVLATGRANRVKEELIFAGVPSERVLDEGCWAGDAAENFPGRGVVMTIKRPVDGPG